MIIKNVVDEDFINYKLPSMVIMFPSCTFKCDKECGRQVCQNSALASSASIEIDLASVVDRYMLNPISKAIVFSGLEPFDSFDDLLHLAVAFRLAGCFDDIVIYTGYTEYEIDRLGYIDMLKPLAAPFVVKYGRFIPDQVTHYDDVLGVNLASDNQYAVRYENET